MKRIVAYLKDAGEVRPGLAVQPLFARLALLTRGISELLLRLQTKRLAWLHDLGADGVDNLHLHTGNVSRRPDELPLVSGNALDALVLVVT